MPGRTYHISAPNAYRYGFNGKENDRETVSTGDGTQDYGMRIYNPALGRFLSVDPLSDEYPWNSTYAFAENDVIRCTDLDGKEKYIQISSTDKNGKLVVEVIPYSKLFPGRRQGSMGSGTAAFKKDPKTGKVQFQEYIPSFNETNLGKFVNWLRRKDTEHFSEPEGNGNLSDQKKKEDIKGDGRLNPNDSPDNPYKDPLDPTTDSSKPNSNSDKDENGWTKIPDQAGNVDKTVGDYNLYKNAKTGDTVEIFERAGMEHITDMKSEKAKEAIRDIKKVESEKP